MNAVVLDVESDALAFATARLVRRLRDGLTLTRGKIDSPSRNDVARVALDLHSHAARLYDGCASFVKIAVASGSSYAAAFEYMRCAMREVTRAGHARASRETHRGERVTERPLAYRLQTRVAASAIACIARRALEARSAANTAPRRVSAPLGKLLYSCPVCAKTFGKTFHYLQHIRVHYRLNMYACSYCPRTFVQQHGLDYHEARCRSGRRQSLVARDETTTYELCVRCDTFYENGRELRNHVIREHATANIDLGINKEQQDILRILLSFI